MSVIDYLIRLLNQIGYAVNLALQIVTTLVTSGWYIVIRDAATVTGDIHVLLEDPTCGQEAQCVKLDTIITTADDIVTLLNDLSTLVGGDRVVNLPATPPTGYGGATASAAAAAVWSFVSADESTQMGVIMAAQSTWLRVARDSLGFPVRIGDHFYVNFDPFSLTNNPVTSYASHSAGEILSTDASLLDFLQRIESTVTWHQLGDGSYWSALAGTGGNALMYCSLTPEEFAWYRANADGLILPSPVPPIWPGIANVTLGTPVAFSGSGLSVAGPMDGIIVTITAVNQPLPHYAYGTAVAWGRLGGLTFVDDNGDAEEYQLFGFVDAIYCPRAMSQADSCQIRNVSGIVGTVTPWTAN
jgi:hypothetical protein